MAYSTMEGHVPGARYVAHASVWLSLGWTLTVHAQVTTAQYDNARTSAYLPETALTPRTVNVATPLGSWLSGSSPVTAKAERRTKK